MDLTKPQESKRFYSLHRSSCCFINIEEELVWVYKCICSSSGLSKIIRSFYSLSCQSPHLRVHSLNVQSNHFYPDTTCFVRSPKVLFITQLLDTFTQLVLLWKILKLQYFHWFWETEIQKTAVQSDTSAQSRKFNVKNYSKLLKNSESNKMPVFSNKI